MPEALALVMQPVSLIDTRAGSVERAYIECLRDRAIPVETQRVMYRAAGIDEVVTLDTGATRHS